MRFLSVVGVVLCASAAAHSQIRQISATFDRDPATGQILVTNHSSTAKIVALTLEGACSPSRVDLVSPDEMLWGISDARFFKPRNGVPISPGKTSRVDVGSACVTAITAVLYSDGMIEGNPSALKFLQENRLAILDEINWAIGLLRLEDSEERSPSEILEVLRMRREHLKSTANPNGDPLPGGYFDSETFLGMVVGTVGRQPTVGSYLSSRQVAMAELNRYAQEIRASLKMLEKSHVLEASDRLR